MDDNSTKRFFDGEPRNRLAERGPDCPSDEALAAFADALLPETQRSRLEAHASGCDYCLEQLAYLSELERADVRPAPADLVERARASGTRTRFRHKRWLGLAAAIVLLVVGRVVLEEPPGRSGTPSESHSRSSDHEVTVRIVSPVDGSTVDGADPSFRWEPTSGVVLYEVTVLSTSGQVVFRAQTEESSLKLADDIRLDQGAEYFLSVRPILGDGRSLEPALSSFSVR